MGAVSHHSAQGRRLGIAVDSRFYARRYVWLLAFALLLCVVVGVAGASMEPAVLRALAEARAAVDTAVLIGG